MYYKPQYNFNLSSMLAFVNNLGPVSQNKCHISSIVNLNLGVTGVSQSYRKSGSYVCVLQKNSFKVIFRPVGWSESGGVLFQGSGTPKGRGSGGR